MSEESKDIYLASKHKRQWDYYRQLSDEVLAQKYRSDFSDFI